MTQDVALELKPKRSGKPCDVGDAVPVEVNERVSTEYTVRVGERLRRLRRQRGLSLRDVEAGSLQEFNASVLGAYERGCRAISVLRLQRLARFYEVPVDSSCHLI